MQEKRPWSQNEFSARLRDLVRDAHENGIDVEGGWNCRNGQTVPDWEVVITEIAKQREE